MFKNKKTQIGEILHDSTAFLAAFFLVVLFLIVSLLFASANQKNIQTKATELQDRVRMNVALLNFLEKQVDIEINNEIQTISTTDLIVLAQIDQKYKTRVSEISKKLEDFCMKNIKETTFGCYFEVQSLNKCPEKSEKGTKYISCFLLPGNVTTTLKTIHIYKI